MLRMIGIFPHPPIVLPEVGRNEWVKVKQTHESMEELAKDFAEAGIKKVVVISPHGPSFRDAILINNDEEMHGDLKNFNYDKEYRFRNDLETAKKIYRHPKNSAGIFVETNPEGSRSYTMRHSLDHGVLVPLYFLEKEIAELEIVTVSPGFLSEKELLSAGEILRDVLDSHEEPYGIVISADLSHRLDKDAYYGFSPAGPVFDQEICDAIEENRLEDIVKINEDIIKEAGQCGYIPLTILVGAVKNKDYDSKLYSYEHPFGVGYLVASVTAER